MKYNLGRHIILVTDVYHFSVVSLHSHLFHLGIRLIRSKYFIAAACFYNLTIPVIKVSILLLYRRIFPQRWFRNLSLAVGALVISYSAAQFFGDIFQCTPVKYLWDKTIPGGHCIHFGSLVIFGGEYNIITDLIILAMPVSQLWQLQIAAARKWELSGIFLMGGLCVFQSITPQTSKLTRYSVCIASIVRLCYASKVGSIDGSCMSPPLHSHPASSLSYLTLIQGTTSPPASSPPSNAASAS